MANTKETGDRIAANLITQTADWFDADNAKPMVNECVKVSRKIIAVLLEASLAGEKIKDLTQMLAYLGKTLDGVGRYIQFSAGKPDSRAELTVASLLPHFTDEELAVFNLAIARMESVSTEGIGDSEKSALH